MRTITTFNALHLGDNLIHLHFLRRMAVAYSDVHFTHGAPDQHLAQLAPLAHDLDNLTIKSIAEVGQGAINAWRGAGGWFYQQPDQWDFLQIHLRWFRQLAQLMGLKSPIRCAADMLFDYPALEQGAGSKEQEPIDFLIINSEPKSGQWSGFDLEAFARLIGHLVFKQKRVVAVRPHRMSITEIGKISQRARCIIGCVTGPMWPCLNVWNGSDTHSPTPSLPLRIHLLDSERVELAPNTVHANSLSLVPEILRDRGLI